MIEEQYFHNALEDPRRMALARRLGLTNIQFNSDDSDFDADTTGVSLRFTFEVKPTASTVAVATMMTIPIAPFLGCCGIDIIHEVELDYTIWRAGVANIHRRGIGGFFFDLVFAAYKRAATNGDGPGMLVASTVSHQDAGIALLRSRRWRRGAKFVNPNTDNEVTLWTKTIPRGKKPHPISYRY